MNRVFAGCTAAGGEWSVVLAGLQQSRGGPGGGEPHSECASGLSEKDAGVSSSVRMEDVGGVAFGMHSAYPISGSKPLKYPDHKPEYCTSMNESDVVNLWGLGQSTL